MMSSSYMTAMKTSKVLLCSVRGWSDISTSTLSTNWSSAGPPYAPRFWLQPRFVTRPRSAVAESTCMNVFSLSVLPYVVGYVEGRSTKGPTHSTFPAPGGSPKPNLVTVATDLKNVNGQGSKS